MSQSETLYVNPDEAIELYDQLRALFDTNECVMEFSAYIAVVQRLSDLKDRVHYCRTCTTRYFKPYVYSCDVEPAEYHQICKSCEDKLKVDEE